MKQCLLASIAAASLWAIPRPAHAQNTPTPEALTLARALVEKSGTGGQAALNGVVLPLPQLLAGLGVTRPDHVQAIVHDAIMPTLDDHESELTDIAVKSTATLLSVAQMKAAIAFYDSEAGRHFVRAKYAVMQGNAAAGAEAIAALRPEIDAQVQAVTRAHGWPQN